jgi:hypothetical protein
MTGDCHVRFLERLGGKFPWPTRLVTAASKETAEQITLANPGSCDFKSVMIERQLGEL